VPLSQFSGYNIHNDAISHEKSRSGAVQQTGLEPWRPGDQPRVCKARRRPFGWMAGGTLRRPRLDKKLRSSISHLTPWNSETGRRPAGIGWRRKDAPY